MKTFNHRVISRRDEQTGEYRYAIHEVYYDSDGAIEGWTERSVSPFGETFQELKDGVYLLQKACRLPILEMQEIDGKECLVDAEDTRALNGFDAFEFMDRSYVALDHAASYLGSHIILSKSPALREAYCKAEDALSALYQTAGQYFYETSGG